MVKLRKSDRESLISKFKKILNLFPIYDIGKKIEEIRTDNMMCGRMSILSDLLFINLLHNIQFEKITDMELIMWCGAFDHEFTAGMSYFTPEQTMSINEMNDEIFRVKCFENDKFNKKDKS